MSHARWRQPAIGSQVARSAAGFRRLAHACAERGAAIEYPIDCRKRLDLVAWRRRGAARRNLGGGEKRVKSRRVRPALVLHWVESHETACAPSRRRSVRWGAYLEVLRRNRASVRPCTRMRARPSCYGGELGFELILGSGFQATQFAHRFSVKAAPHLVPGGVPPLRVVALPFFQAAQAESPIQNSPNPQTPRGKRHGSAPGDRIHGVPRCTFQGGPSVRSQTYRRSAYIGRSHPCASAHTQGAGGRILCP
jgi:hypothetical protein